MQIDAHQLTHPQTEDEIRQELTDYYAESYGERIHGYVDLLMNIDCIIDRYNYLFGVVDRRVIVDDRPVLVSGCSIGPEMLLARCYGYGEIHGVEVDPFLVCMCQKRLAHLPDMHPRLYDGDRLPYADQHFGLVLSGHVIEHTRDPQLYLSECMRVLQPGGYISLEFPNRYHRKELHTGLPSFEWLPRRLRNPWLRILYSRFSPLGSAAKQGYAGIIRTNLQQVGMPDIRQYLKASGYGWQILDVTTAAPGILRCVIKKPHQA